MLSRRTARTFITIRATRIKVSAKKISVKRVPSERWSQPSKLSGDSTDESAAGFSDVASAFDAVADGSDAAPAACAPSLSITARQTAKAERKIHAIRNRLP